MKSFRQFLDEQTLDETRRHQASTAASLEARARGERERARLAYETGLRSLRAKIPEGDSTEVRMVRLEGALSSLLAGLRHQLAASEADHILASKRKRMKRNPR